MQKRDKIIIISAFSVLGLLLVIAIIMLLFQHREIESQSAEIEEITAVMEFEKQQSINEFEEMQKQYEDYYINTSNDSLLKLIDEEKQKVQQLLQELKTVKATNTRRIAELKKELSTVRGVLKTYVERVDSLNTVNSNLRSENQKVRRQYEERSRELEEQRAQAEELDKKVTMASILEASDITLSTLNDRGKKARSIKKVAKFQIDFRILRNITAERGRKTIYMRITDKDENLLTSPGENHFFFEGMDLEYSAKKDFDFSGETEDITIYYTVNNQLKESTYTIALFTDGNLIGEKSFILE
ncbi:MAG: hypothetical protein II620_02695 [Paludibacteraceae bacterium]|nr:hypothetical protein [Paludibacteraceae bacterium]MBQ2065776.1 hypothetical protein [Paludibacteraceae bacterium]MBQ4032850.1 hypothetical protein [Paludibacteraceae bacterium]